MDLNTVWHSSSRLASADTTLPKRLSQCHRWFWWHCSFQATLWFSNDLPKLLKKKNGWLYFQHPSIGFHTIQVLSPGILSYNFLLTLKLLLPNHYNRGDFTVTDVLRSSLTQLQLDLLTLFKTKSHSVAYLDWLKYPKYLDCRCEPQSPNPQRLFWVCTLMSFTETSDTVSPKEESLSPSITCPSMVFSSQERNCLQKRESSFQAFFIAYAQHILSLTDGVESTFKYLPDSSHCFSHPILISTSVSFSSNHLLHSSLLPSKYRKFGDLLIFFLFSRTNLDGHSRN